MPWFKVIARRDNKFGEKRDISIWLELLGKEVVLEALLLFKCREVDEDPFRREDEKEA